MNLFVGNISKEITKEDLQEAFLAYGQVRSATVVKDHMTGESRGFGFVEMHSNAEAEVAIHNLREIKGNMVTINIARTNTDRSRKGSRKGAVSRRSY